MDPGRHAIGRSGGGINEPRAALYASRGYAAFALAMGLGLIGTLYYLTATYRRPVRPGEMFQPLLPGLPLAAARAAAPSKGGRRAAA